MPNGAGDYAAQLGEQADPENRSGIAVKPLYTARGLGSDHYMDDLGFPGQLPMTRGIYPSMHRGRTWTQRQLIGLGTPEDYNARLKTIIASWRHRRQPHSVQFGLSRL